MDGKEASFFVSTNKDVDWKLFEQFEKKKSYVGKKVKIVWHKVELFIPEAGQIQIIDVMVRLNIVK